MKSFFLPNMTAETKFYWDGLANRQLLFQKCKDCGYIRWPASVICPECHSKEYAITQLSGKGVIYSFVVFRKAFHPSLTDKLPYIVATVDLDEGPRILGVIEYKFLDYLKPDVDVHIVWDESEESDSIQVPTFIPDLG